MKAHPSKPARRYFIMMYEKEQIMCVLYFAAFRDSMQNAINIGIITSS